jgi:high-affinity nickel-transport protein
MHSAYGPCRQLSATIRRHVSLSAEARGVGIRKKLQVVYALLIVLNVGAWCWAIAALHARPSLLGVALLVYGLGLRHAVDADHIAAIDNVTRKLMQAGQRPVSVGFWFAMGHSTIVVLVTICVACATRFLGVFQHLRSLGEAIGTSVSVVFLLAIAVMNLAIFLSIHKSYRHYRREGVYVEEDLDRLLHQRGFLARIFRPLFRLVTRSHHMFLLGLLFGLGLDTSTEIAMFTVSAQETVKGVSILAILVLPALFAAGMSLIDTTDGVVMLGAYDWAFMRPLRKLCYNMTITLVSALVAIVVAATEAIGWLGEKFRWQGAAWKIIDALNGHTDSLGFAVIGMFVLAWALSYLIYRAQQPEGVEVSMRKR